MAFDKNHTSLGMKIIIIIFAVVLVVSLCLPFFSSCSSTAGSSDATQDDSSSSSSSSSSTASATTVAGIRATHQTLIDSLTSRLAADPGNLTYMASLGNAYYDCAAEMQSATDAGENADAVAEEFSSAVVYYDQYLAAVEAGAEAQGSSVSAVTVDRCVCLFYGGSQQDAVADLAEFLAGTPDYAMGWYNLGVMYETMGDAESAKAAYERCSEVDSDGTVGAYANLRKALIESSEQAAAEGSSGEAASTDASGSSDASETDASADGSGSSETAGAASGDEAEDGGEASGADEAGASSEADAS